MTSGHVNEWRFMRPIERVLYIFAGLWMSLTFGIVGAVAGGLLEEWLDSSELADYTLIVAFGLGGLALGLVRAVYEIHLSLLRTADPAYAEAIRTHLNSSPRQVDDDDVLRVVMNVIVFGSIAALALALLFSG